MNTHKTTNSNLSAEVICHPENTSQFFLSNPTENTWEMIFAVMPTMPSVTWYV